jgi:death-on-curing protein
MTGEPRWISKRRALRMLNEETVAMFGGVSGLRDEGLLDSALSRPLHTYANNADSTLADLAASYCSGLAKNHAFLDGNKRASFLSIGIGARREQRLFRCELAQRGRRMSEPLTLQRL